MLAGGLAALLQSFGRKFEFPAFRFQLRPLLDHALARAFTEALFSFRCCRSPAQSPMHPASAGIAAAVQQGLCLASAAGAGPGSASGALALGAAADLALLKYRP
jgi:hypothetical protein